jgi:AAT family amino acid transporter/GABA permease
VAGVVVLMVMRMLGEMAVAVPGVGSFTEYARICIVGYLATALAQIRIRRRIEAAEPQRLTLKMWLFPWLSYAVVAAIVGVLVAMAAGPALRPQVLASVASLAVASAAYWVVARRQRQDDGSATGYLSPIGQHAMEGRQ